MFVSENDIEIYVDMVLALPIFHDCEKKDTLKDFLVDVFKELYRDNPKDIEDLFSNTFTLNPISYVFALSLGILNEDAEKAIKTFLKDTIQLFVNKASIKDALYIKNLLLPFGINIKLYNVVVENRNQYVGKEIETGEKIVFNTDSEFMTDIHLLRIDDYARNLYEEEFTTIVLHLNISNVVEFDNETTAPPTAMIAYAFTKYRDEEIHFALGSGNVFSVSMLEFMQIFRYIYLRYIQLRNPGFDINTQPDNNVYWYMLHDQDNLDELYDLVYMYLYEIENRSDMDNYIRMEAHLLNENVIVLNNNSIEEVYDYLYGRYPIIMTYLEQYLNDDDVLYEFLNTMRVALITKIHSMTYANDVDRVSFLVFLYLANTVVFNIEKISTETKDILYTFKKYFLPIYTTFDIKVEYINSIKNRLNKLYTDYRVKNRLLKPFISLVELWDDQSGFTKANQEDWILIESSGEAITTPKWYDDLNLNDLREMFLSGVRESDTLEIEDDHTIKPQIFLPEQISEQDDIHGNLTIDDIVLHADVDSAVEFLQNISLTDNDIQIHDNVARKYMIIPSSAERDNINDSWVFTIYNEDNTIKEIVSSS